MITDAYNTLTLSMAGVNNGAYGYAATGGVNDAIDLRLKAGSTSGGDIGEGKSLYITLVVTTNFAGAGASADLQVGFSSDPTTPAGTWTSIFTTGATAITSLVAGKSGSEGSAIHGYVVSYRIQPLRGQNYGPYLMLRGLASAANITAGVVKAHITLEPLDGRQFYDSGYVVQTS